MTVFRWAMASLAVMAGVASLFSLAISVAFDNEMWGRRARNSRHVLVIVALLWFNIEVWGRVVLTLVRWNG